MQNGSDWNPRFAVFGDLGLQNAQSLKRLRRDVLKHDIDMVIHVGDFGYDLNDLDGNVKLQHKYGNLQLQRTVNCNNQLLKFK